MILHLGVCDIGRPGDAGCSVSWGSSQRPPMTKKSIGSPDQIGTGSPVTDLWFEIFQKFRAPDAGWFLVSPITKLTIVNVHTCYPIQKAPVFQHPGPWIFHKPISRLQISYYLQGKLDNGIGLGHFPRPACHCRAVLRTGGKLQSCENFLE
jgi:hypothetical protein